MRAVEFFFWEGGGRGAAAVDVTSCLRRVTQQRDMNVVMRFVTSFFSKNKKQTSDGDVGTRKHVN